MKQIRGGLMVVVVAMLGVACGDGGTSTACDESLSTFRIGVVMPITGAVQVGGIWVQAGLLAEAHVNADGGINGRCVVLEILDSESSPGVAYSKYDTLLDDPSIKAIVTSLSSSTACLLAAEYVGITLGACPAPPDPARGVKLPPILCQACSAPDFDGFPLPPIAGASPLWRLLENNVRQGEILAQLAEDGGALSAGTYAIDLPFGRGQVGAFSAAFTGLQDANWAALHPDDNTADFQADLNAIYAFQGGPDALLINTYPANMLQIVDHWKALGTPGKIVLGHTAVFDELLSVTTLADADYTKISGTGYALAGGLRGAEFEVDFLDAVGQPSGQLTGMTYDAIMLAALAALASGADDPTRTDVQSGMQLINDPNGTVIGYGDFATAIETLSAGGTINYQGVTGDLDYTGDFNAIVTPIARWHVENRQFVFTPIP